MDTQAATKPKSQGRPPADPHARNTTLRALRLQTRKRVQELATEADITTVTWYTLEAGGNFSLETLVRVSRVLGRYLKLPPGSVLLKLIDMEGDKR